MNWKVIKELAARALLELERHVEQQDNATCMCGHKKAQHCGCGAHCLAVTGGTGAAPPCACKSFCATPTTQETT